MTAPVRTVRPGWIWGAATEVSIVLLNAATVYGFTRLFVADSFDWALLVHVVVAHGVVAGLRWAGTGVATSAVASGGALIGAVWLTATLAPPSADATGSMWDQLVAAWRSLTETGDLVVMTPGFAVALVVTVWMVAWWSDLGAFRLRAAVEAVSPSAAVFVVVSLLAAGGPRVGAAVVWFSAAGLYGLSHRIDELYRHPGWVRRGRGEATLRAYRSGVVALAGVLLGAFALGPLLPSASADPVIDLRADPSVSRSIPPPLGQVRPDLVDDPDREVFSVSSPVGLYWRTAGLARYDGVTWALGDGFGPPDGPLEGGDPPTDSLEVTQSFEATRPGTVFLPAAFMAREVSGPGVDGVRWQASTATLLASEDFRDEPLQYDVVSSIPVFDRDQLGGTTGGVTRITSESQFLPGNFPASIGWHAVRIVEVAGAFTPYEQAAALEAYLRGGTFEYSLNVPASHSLAAVESFLFDTQVGYCEHFASAFALLGRSLGLPVRLAVGYTTGTPSADDPGRFVVRGRDAHVWPEVWFDGVGWVAFEPTPGRDIPAGMSSPGGADPDRGTTDPVPGEEQSPGPAPPSSPGSDSGSGGAPPDEVEPPAPVEETNASLLGRVGSGLLRLVWLAVVAALLVVVALAVRAGFRVYLRRRRRLLAVSDADQVTVAWEEATEDLGVLGVSPQRSETPVEFADRVYAGSESPALVELSALFTTVTFSGVARDGWGAEAYQLAAEVQANVAAQTTPWQRLLAAVWVPPRTFLSVDRSEASADQRSVRVSPKLGSYLADPSSRPHAAVEGRWDAASSFGGPAVARPMADGETPPMW